MSNVIEQLEARRAAARMGGGQKRIDAQHSKGRLTARERLDVLLDEDSSKNSTCSLNTIALTLVWPTRSF